MLVDSRRRIAELILLDSGEKACRGSSDNDARSDGEDREDGGSLCEHGVNCGVVLGLEWWKLGSFWDKKDGKNENAPQKSGR